MFVTLFYISAMKTMLYAMVAFSLCAAGVGVIYTIKMMAAATEVMEMAEE